MADGIKMLLAMGLFFGAMYVYSWAPELLAVRREKRKEKKKEKKKLQREKVLTELQIKRDAQAKVFEERRNKIKEHKQWLDEMNKKIKSKLEKVED